MGAEGWYEPVTRRVEKDGSAFGADGGKMEASMYYVIIELDMTDDQNTSDSFSFLSNILKPGSSLQPTFLIIVDCTFLSLLLLFIALAFVTAGNLHVLILMGIELCLWASVKWYDFYNFSLYNRLVLLGLLPSFELKLHPHKNMPQLSRKGRRNEHSFGESFIVALGRFLHTTVL